MPGADIATPSWGQIPIGSGAPAPIPASGPVQMGGPQAVSSSSASMAALVKLMLQRMAPQSRLSTPTPSANYSPNALSQEGYLMGKQGSNLGEIGAGLANIGTAIHNAVAQNKEKQLRTAMADWSTLQQRWDNALTVSGGDEKKAQELFEKDPYTQAVLGDAKKMKNLAKAFSVDYLKPEKTTVYGEALKRHTQVNKAQGMMNTVKKVLTLGRQQQPQLSPEQRQQMTHEMASKLPFTHAQADPQKTAEFVEKMREFDIRSQEATARIAETHERTLELIRHNQEEVIHWQQQLEEAKARREDTSAYKSAILGLQKQAQELRELDVMMKAANQK